MVNNIHNSTLAVRTIILPGEHAAGVIVCVRKIGPGNWRQIALLPEISQQVADACDETDKWYILES